MIRTVTLITAITLAAYNRRTSDLSSKVMALAALAILVAAGARGGEPEATRTE